MKGAAATSKETNPLEDNKASEEEFVPVMENSQDIKAEDKAAKKSKIVFTEFPSNMPLKIEVIHTAPVQVQDTPTEEEKLKKRLERFKSPEQDKLKSRAARFGMNHPELEAEKLKMRAAKFGLKSEEVEVDKLKKRAERFGIHDPEAVKKARLAKFKPLAPVAKTLPVVTKSATK